MREKKNIYLMYLIIFLQGFVFYGPIATIYRRARGLSLYEIFILSSISLILMIVFEIPWGWFADRYGYKRTLIFSNFMFFISKIVFYFADSFLLFLVETLLMAISISGISGCDIALIYSSINKEDGEKIIGRYNAAGTSGFFIASFLSTIVIAKSIDYAALLTILPYGLAAFLTLFIEDVNDYSQEKLTLKKSFKNVLNKKWMLVFVIAIAFVQEVQHMITVFLNQPQYLKSGINLKYFGILMAIMQTISMVSVKAYKLTQKLGREKSLKTLFLIIGICSFMLSYINSPILSVLLIATVTGSFALIHPIAVNIENQSIVTNDRATILSIYAMINNVIAAFINIIVGKATDVSIEFAFKISSIIVFLGFITLIVFFSNYNVISSSNEDANEKV
ncbi:hypothetical protein TR13x_03930 [Caloranaerobacter sp. TR13]|uniref:MFS transporter n=1 Tax=Caloranaerobacter sp. TR13 TaxID=1302151 RepID=UPI0006D460F1|nr:MFS transporter [Caloranaerobacter sp. TR13]KPU27680.1 hypothetical protein TR13x_03930 [Caloranaerobacter sp. TR13]